MDTFEVELSWSEVLEGDARAGKLSSSTFIAGQKFL